MSNSSLLHSSQKILVITETIPDLAALLCSNAMLSIFSKQQKQINWYIDESKFPSAYINLLPRDRSLLLNTFNSKDFYAVVNETAGVEDIEIVKEDSRFNLLFRTKTGELGIENILLKPLRFDFDLVIFLMNEAQSRIVEDKEVQQLIETTESFFVQTDSNSPLALELTKLIFQNQLSLDSYEATLLLAAVMWETMDKNNLEYYSIVNKLIFKYKADFEKALGMINFTLSPDITEWRKKAFKNLNLFKNINYSIIEGEVKANEILNIPNEYKLPLFAKAKTEDKDKDKEKNKNEDENYVIITKLEKSTIIFACGVVSQVIISKVENSHVHYLSMNSGLLTIVTSAKADEVIKLIGINEGRVEEKHRPVDEPENVKENISKDVEKIMKQVLKQDTNNNIKHDIKPEQITIQIKDIDEIKDINDVNDFKDIKDNKITPVQEKQKIQSSSDSTINLSKSEQPELKLTPVDEIKDKADSAEEKLKAIEAKADRNTSVLNKQQTRKPKTQTPAVSQQNLQVKNQKPLDPLPPANW